MFHQEAGRPALIRSLCTAVFAGILALLTGCSATFDHSTAGGSSSPITPTRTPGSISGTLHGGQQSIAYATVKLYASGSSGYGAGATLLATATTSHDGMGAFNFTKLTTGTYPNTGNTYTCPATGDPIIYLVSTGGNTQSTGSDASTFNTAATLMAVLGPCSTIYSGTQVVMNEITTVAGIFALAPYFNPATEAIGAASSAQAQLGLSNAVAALPNLVYTAIGGTGFPQTYAGANLSVVGVAVTATAEYSKIITIADILAACINSTNSSSSGPSTQCQQLLGAAISFSGTAPTDTLQAAYYMATNPSDKGTLASACTSAASNFACLLALPGATPPFQPIVSTGIVDWTIGVTYTSTGTCSGGGPLISGPAKTLIDASGDIWFLSGAATNANLAEISPLGKPLFCAGNMANGRGLAMDPTGNIWAAWSSATKGGLYELPAGSTTLIAWPTTADITFIPYNVTSDVAGNIFVLQAERGDLIYKYTAPGANTTPSNPTFFAGPVDPNAVSVNPTAADYLIPSPTASVVYALPNAFVPSAVYPTTAAKTIAISSYSFNAAADYYSGKFYYTNTPPVAGDQLTLSGFADPAGVGFNGTHIYVGTVLTSYGYFPGAVLNTTGANVNQTDSGIGTTNPGSSLNAGPGTAYGLALDSSNAIYSVTSGGFGSSLRRPTHYAEGAPGSTGSGVNGTQGMGGISGGRSVALDGAGTLWIGNEYSATGNATATSNYPIAAILYSSTTSAFTSLSPDSVTLNATTCSLGNGNGCPTQGGFYKNDILQALDLAVDPSGTIWVMNTGPSITAGGANGYTGASITQILGPGTPTVTPLIRATVNGTLATRP